MVDGHRERDVAVGRRHDRMWGTAVLAPGNPRLARRTRLLFLGWAVRQIHDPDRELQLLADQAKARRLINDESSVALLGPSGEQDMQRRGPRLFERVCIPAWQIVHLAIG